MCGVFFYVFDYTRLLFDQCHFFFNLIETNLFGISNYDIKVSVLLGS